MSNEIENTLSQIQSSQFEERIKEMKEGFNTLNALNVRTIPESIFVSNFLPLFTGEISNKLPLFNDLLNVWLNIAGTNYSPVNVIDTNGAVVVVVPPINDKDTFKPIVDRNEDISYAFHLAKSKSMISPLLGKNVINEELSSRVDSLVDSKENNTLKEQWNKLFAHYGKGNSAVVKAVDTKDNSDEFEY